MIQSHFYWAEKAYSPGTEGDDFFGVDVFLLDELGVEVFLLELDPVVFFLEEVFFGVLFFPEVDFLLLLVFVFEFDFLVEPFLLFVFFVVLDLDLLDDFFGGFAFGGALVVGLGVGTAVA